ncbi:TsoY family (seleno)protein [Primorskyibacter sp. 2E107]|uniref:TsoY family (seleno)protein n=1 Tax=Primorskyibacter sp. 2E107 TaxID=3403458 RepID=UPI003AF86FFA
MAATQTRPADIFSPIYFLGSLGAGGISVSFFMFLMFWVPHPGRPVPIFEDIAAAWDSGETPMQIAIAIAMAGIAAFTFLNIKSLLWSLSAYRTFKRTDAYARLRASNAESTLLAMPLALAMSVNALFIVGLVFVPRLWTVIEFLFPAALGAFGLIAVMAFRLIGAFLGRVLSKGGIFDVTAHNSFAQLTPALAIAMIAVGFAAPAAMSANPATVAASLILSTLLAILSVLYTLFAATTAVSSMLHYGTAREAGPTLMIIVPIVTVLSILMMRQSHGLHTTFEAHGNAGQTMVFLARMLSVQIAFLALGIVVLRAQGYFKDFVIGSKTSAGSYALVCPFVAFAVLLQFFVNKGLVAAEVIAKFDTAYWILTAVAIASQMIAIAIILRLNRQHFSRNTAVPIPAA